MATETAAGWVKHPRNPVLGSDLGIVYDVCVLAEEDGFRMYFSWSDKNAIALTKSKDGVSWSEPTIVLEARPGSAWEEDVNRPVVVAKDGLYHMWYTGQAPGSEGSGAKIGYAQSSDGEKFQRLSDAPVLVADVAWEKVATMCPHVMWDDSLGCLRMWYSAGHDDEPDAIGYATSTDGIHWDKYAANPVFLPEQRNEWEQDKVTGTYIMKDGDEFLMFYIGFADVDTASICLARSKDGITGWERHPNNPIIRRSLDPAGWDSESTYKPYALKTEAGWLLWYNGRKGDDERIGLVRHGVEPLFPA